MQEACTIRFMGDVMLGRYVNVFINKNGYAWPWGNVLPLLQEPGLNIINLETTLTGSTKKVNKVFNFRAEPDKVQSLAKANIHIACVANNHILDYSIEGLEETLRVLDEAGIRYSGAGLNKEQAHLPVICTCNGTKIGFLGCTDNEPGWEANHHPGTFYAHIGDLEKLKAEVENLKKEVDLLILSYHWGPNMAEEPDMPTREFAHQLIDIGVDIIHGHSAHIFQGIEVYKGKLILYDTGDFVDDYRVDPMLRNDRSFLYECKVAKDKILGLRLVPVQIDAMQVNIAKEHVHKWCIARVQMLSKKYGTKVREDGQVEIHKTD